MAHLKQAEAKPPSSATKLAVLLALVFAATIALRLEGIAGKKTISHDEGITYLSATCHQGEYSRYVFDGTPVPASTWQKMLQIDDYLCFGRISADLGSHDIHPPLYFWALHVWSLLVGVEVWTGPTLNLMFSIVSTILLYRFAQAVLCHQTEALLVTFTYALNSAVTGLSGLARQYDLLVLISLLIIGLTVRYAEANTQRRRDLPILLTLAALGGLTHYHFVLPISACVVYLAAKLCSPRKRAFIAAVGALAIGYGSTFIIHPYFISSMETELGFLGALEHSAESFLFRLMKIGVSFASYYYLIVLLLALAIWHVVQRGRNPLAWWRQNEGMDWSGSVVLFLAAWIGGGILLLYLTSITPLHQMSSKYYAMAWPFISFVPVFALRLVRQRPTVKLYLYLFPLVFAFLAPAQRIVLERGEHRPETMFEHAQLLLVDNPARGIFPRIIWHAPADVEVIAATQEALLERPEPWLDLVGDAFIYVSEVSYGSTVAGQADMLLLLDENGYEVNAAQGNIADAGTVFEVQRLSAAR